MNRQYSLAIQSTLLDEAGRPLLMANGQPRLAETTYPFAQSRRNASAICNAIGISIELDLLHICETDAIEIPLDRIASMTPSYSDSFIALDRDVTINGQCVDRVASAATIAELAKACTAARSALAPRAFLRAH